MMTPYVVTRYYRAPEVILGMGYKENGQHTIYLKYGSVLFAFVCKISCVNTYIEMHRVKGILVFEMFIKSLTVTTILF